MAVIPPVLVPSGRIGLGHDDESVIRIVIQLQDVSVEPLIVDLDSVSSFRKLRIRSGAAKLPVLEFNISPLSLHTCRGSTDHSH